MVFKFATFLLLKNYFKHAEYTFLKDIDNIKKLLDFWHFLQASRRENNIYINFELEELQRHTELNNNINNYTKLGS